MSEIALYEVLTKLGVEPERAKDAVVDIAKKEEVATKLDIARVEAAISNIQTELKYPRWFMVFGFSITIAILKLL